MAELNQEAESTRQRWQEIANRGLQDKFGPKTRARFNEAVRRGFITLPEERQQQSTVPREAIEPLTPEQAQAEKDKVRNDIATGRLEVLGSILSSAVAEPAAGIAGIATTLTPFLRPGAGKAVVEGVRERLTFEPRTERGQQALQTVGGVLEPVGKAFKFAEESLGGATFELTGSPALAAAAATIPTAIAEAIGIGGVKGTVGTVKAVKRIKEARQIKKSISEAVPTIEQLKDTSRAIYREIDDLGVTINPTSYNKLFIRLDRTASEGGADVDITPDTMKALSRFEERVGTSVSLTDLDKLRKITQNAAKSNNPADASLGVKLIDRIDSFLDNTDTKDFIGPPKNVKNISKRYKAARDLWGRARRSELLGEAFEKARNQASGFENGIRVQFRSILNNKRQRRFFNDQELDVIRRVVRGDKKENIAKLIGRLGFSEGGATNVLGGFLGVAMGGAIGGTPGAVAVPLIGQISRALAQRLTRGNAEFADQVIRAGKNAKLITKAYLDNVPKKLRDPAELSELLMRPDIDLKNIPKEAFALRAARIAQQRRVEGIAADIAGSTLPDDLVNGNRNGTIQ